MVAGVLRVLGGLLLALGLLAAICMAFGIVIHGVLLLFRYIPLTGQHKNKPLDLTNRKR
jgi:hypothetical protein